MSERMESFLNAMTILGTVLVSFILVVCVALGIMLAAGVFNKHYEPLVGLKFNKTESQVILENEGVIYLTVTANTASVSESGAIITDDTIDTEIKLTVRNAKNVIDNSVIDVPSVVKKGEPFAVKAKLAADGSNKGGICYINAETSDMLYRVATPIEIKVDVPVKQIFIEAKDANTGMDLDLENTKFIYQDSAQLSVRVEPERSLYIFGDQNQTKEITYVSSSPLSAAVGLNTGLLNIDYNPVYTSDEPLTEPLSTVQVTAKIQKFSIADPLNEKVVSSTADLGLYPLQLGKILIKNETFSDENAQFKTKLFSGSSLLISAEETGLSNVLNLNIFLEPTIVKDTSSADYNPLSDLSKFLVTAVFEGASTGEFVPDAVSIQQFNVHQYNGKQVSYWEIKPNRLLQTGEKVYLAMNMLDRSEKYTIKREVTIEEVPVETTSFEYTNTAGTIISNVSLEILKHSDSEDVNDGATEIKYTFSKSNNPTFTKVVNFVTKADSALAEDPVNINEVCSAIIAADSDTYQITNNSDNSFIIQPKGAGKVNICSYLVRTNELGQPIDAFYNIITTDATLANQKGYTLPTGFCKANDIATAQKGMYIVQQEFPEFVVTVKEKLRSFTFYTSTDFDEDHKVADFVMGTNNVNAVRIFAKPNSTLAIPENSTAYGTGMYPMVQLLENQAGATDKIFDDLLGNITGSQSSYKNSGTKYSQSNPYTRWFEFKLSTARASDDTSTPKRTLTLTWQNSGEELSSQAQLQVTTINVPVSYITINDDTDETGEYRADTYGVDINDGYWNWSLIPNIGGEVQYAVKNGTETENRIYHYLTFASSRTSGDLPTPMCKSVASTEYTAGGIIKAPSTVSVRKSLFLFTSSIIGSENPIEYGESKYTSIDSLMKALCSADVADSDKKELWKLLAIRMDNNISANGNKNPADEYATIVDSKLYIKNAIPKNSTLYMFYISGSDEENYATAFNQVMPIAIKVNYNWPTFESAVKGYNISDDAQFNDSTLGKVYYISDKDENQKTRMFTMDSINQTKMSYFNFDTQINLEGVAVSSSITIPGTGYIEMTTKDEFDTESGVATKVAVFTLKQSGLPEGSTITVPIARKIYFAIMSNDDWGKVFNSMENGFVTGEEAIAKLIASGYGYDIGTENLTFVVQDISKSEETTEGQGE